MIEKSIFIIQCTNPDCNFRTTSISVTSNLICPVCSSKIILVQRALNPSIPVRDSIQPVSDLTVVLDNIRSVFNVGSIFRTADAVGVKIIYLCGVTPTPDHPKLSKASLGAEWSVAWQYSSNVVSTVNNLKDSGKRIYCLEETATSKSIFELNTDMNPQPNVLIVGNEITGIDPAILEMCDQVVDIPMLGYKRSLNVAVAFGIAIYQFRMHISK